MGSDSNDDVTAAEVFTKIISSRPRGAQAQLARDLNVRPQTITKWMTSLPVERWVEVAHALAEDPLLFARETGALEEIPWLVDVPDDQLEAWWTRSFSNKAKRKPDHTDEFSTAIRAAHEERLAEEAGINRQGELEVEVRRLQRALERLAELVGVDPAQLLRGDDDPPELAG